jgi:erythromycin esterase-like protein
MSDRVFRDRRDAGRVLAGLLDKYRGRPDLLVLALPRGGCRWVTRWRWPSAPHSTSSWSASWASRARRSWLWARSPPGEWSCSTRTSSAACASGPRPSSGWPSRRAASVADDELFYAEQNAKIVKASAEYYRSMFAGRVSSWNLRDRHMVDTLEALADHLTRQRGERARIVVWAHNSHLGDARATELGSQGELNVGQLVRERHGGDCRLLGFTTYTGTVTAADDWDRPADRKWVRPALPDSVEELLHEAGEKEFMLSLQPGSQAVEPLRSAHLERAIGVIYRPDTERRSHYFRARVAEQFDAVIHIDETRAVEPLERTAGWERGEAPETYPFTV